MLFNCNIFADEDVMFYFLISIDMGIDRKMYIYILWTIEFAACRSKNSHNSMTQASSETVVCLLVRRFVIFP